MSGQLDARGRYASTPTFLVVTDEEGPGHCEAERATGIYKWKRDGNTVRLTVVEDLCRWRAFAISLKPWRIRGARTEGVGRPSNQGWREGGTPEFTLVLTEAIDRP